MIVSGDFLIFFVILNYRMPLILNLDLRSVDEVEAASMSGKEVEKGHSCNKRTNKTVDDTTDFGEILICAFHIFTNEPI